MKKWMFLPLTVFLLLFSGCGSTTASQGRTTVHVTLSEYTIESSVTTFERGRTYHFIVVNDGQVDHEFMITPIMEMTGMSMAEMDRMAFAAIDKVKPGEMRTLDYTFPSSATAGSIEFGCHYPGHYEAGMHTNVLLQ